MTIRSLFRQYFSSPIIIFFALVSVGVLAQVQTTVIYNGKQQILVRRVFVNVIGDPKLAHRLLTFIDLELEDASFLPVTTEAEADAEIDAKVDPDVATTNLGLGLLKLSTTASGKTNTLTSCESLSSSEDGELFGSSAASMAKQLREKYPRAKKVRLDQTSDVAASKVFGDELPSFLKNSGLQVVESEDADISIHINLLRTKVPVEERLVNYQWTVTLRNGSRPSFSDGTGILSARVPSPPEQCPDRVENLDWLANDDPLFRLSRELVKQLRMTRKMAANKVTPK